MLGAYFACCWFFLYRSVFTVYFLRQKAGWKHCFFSRRPFRQKIGVQLGTTGDTLVSDYETDGSNTTVERFNKGNDAIQALKQGKIDAVVIDAQPAQSFVAANSDLMILPEEFANEDYAIAIAKAILPWQVLSTTL